VTTYAFVAAERANHAVATLCRVVGASVSGFYAWLRAIPSRQNRAEADAALRGHISRIFVAKRRVYGAPRIHAELRREGHRHARRRIERLMRDMGLQASRGQRRKPQTTTSRHDQPPRPAATTSRHDQPPRPADRAQSARPLLCGRASRCRVAGRHLLHSNRRGLFVPGRQRIWRRVRLSAGRWPSISRQGSASTLWSWPSSAADPHGGSFTIATAACKADSSGRRNRACFG
jgi:hypothetical protein